jgi:AcrR family transcriptional regulator
VPNLASETLASGRRPRPGRRASQKAERESRILRAAKVLFGRRGYAETAIEDIARRAGVAVGTIYNYFPSKADLVLALLRRETGDTLAEGQAVIERCAGSRDASACVHALFDVYVDLLARQERAQLRELLAAALANPETIGRAAFEADQLLLAQLHALLASLQQRGALAGDVHTGQAAMLLYAVYASWLFVYAANDAASLEVVREQVRTGIALAMRGFARS